MHSPRWVGCGWSFTCAALSGCGVSAVDGRRRGHRRRRCRQLPSLAQCSRDHPTPEPQPSRSSRAFTERVFENSRWAGVCLAENRRSRLLVGSVITKSPPRPGAHNAIIADLAMPVVPAPRGGRTWLRGVLVVGDRRRVGDPRTAVACAGQHGRPRRTTREALPPCDSGRHPVYRARCYRVAATAGGVPAGRDGVRGVRPLGPRRGVAAHPRRAARPTAGAGRAGPVPDRGDHRLADGTRRRHRAPIQPRLGWRQDERTASSGTSPWM